MLNKPVDIGFGERVCHCCNQVFLITTPLRQYLYKIEINSNTTRYYCRYTHYKKGLEFRDEEKQSTKEAYQKRRTGSSHPRKKVYK